MAIVGSCIESHPAFVSVDRIPAPIAQRFPVPLVARGFCIDVENLILSFEGPTYSITGATVNPESNYMEITTGQIWPR